MITTHQLNADIQRFSWLSNHRRLDWSNNAFNATLDYCVNLFAVNLLHATVNHTHILTTKNDVYAINQSKQYGGPKIY